jgi:Ni,Fe-hydrogenase III small subunit/formate hydrogenlyase subunit 6/NADH:ubiquinone oxidoreductase subunit I
MLKILKTVLTGGVATNDFPSTVGEPPDGFRGKPVIDVTRCTPCEECAAACPTKAITLEVRKGPKGSGVTGKTLSINYGDCIFCGECESVCPDAVHLTKEFQLATLNKRDLISSMHFTVNREGDVVSQEEAVRTPQGNGSLEEIGRKVREKVRQLYSRSLHIREVDAGSCNGCEVEITALNNPVYDLERFGVHFVASPRHADMLLVTGPVTRNMEIALRQTYDATPDPKLVIAVGACAIGGGVFGKSSVSCGGVDTTVPVDVYIPGCPPRPEALLHGILCAIERETSR